MTKEILARRLFGMVFYFFDNPDRIRCAIYEVLRQLLSQPFFSDVSRFSTDGERYRVLKKRIDQVAIPLVENHDFERSLFFSAHNSSPTESHTARIEFLGRNLKPEFLGRSPNYLFVEVPEDVDVDLAWSFFTDSFSTLPTHLAYGDHVIAPHPERMPRSGSTAAQLIRESENIAKGFWEVWGNPDYRLIVGSSLRCIDSASNFIGLGKSITSEIRQEGLDPLSIQEFFSVEVDGVSLFRATDKRQRRAMNAFLNAFFCELPRPTMFWKPDQWTAWVSQIREER